MITSPAHIDIRSGLLFFPFGASSPPAWPLQAMSFSKAIECS